jgi:hypothetical protein
MRHGSQRPIILKSGMKLDRSHGEGEGEDQQPRHDGPQDGAKYARPRGIRKSGSTFHTTILTHVGETGVDADQGWP